MKTNTYEDQAIEFLSSTKSTLSIEFDALVKKWSTEPVNQYWCEITTKDATYGFRFWDSLNNTQKGITPTYYDVLSCINFECSTTHKEFCDEFGYSDDSIEALNIWRAVQDQNRGLKSIYTESELEQLAEIQ